MRASFPSEPIKQRLAEVFAGVVEGSPDVLIIPGIENWITRAMLGALLKNGWGIAETQMEGQNLLRQEQMQRVLLQYALKPADLNIRNCKRSIVNAVAGQEDPVKKGATERSAKSKLGCKRKIASCPTMRSWYSCSQGRPVNPMRPR